MNRLKTSLLSIALGLLAMPVVFGQGAKQGFGFNSDTIGSLAGRAVSLTGGGAYDLPAFVHSGGNFKCLTNITAGPLAGCQAGEGVRWDAVELLASSTFKCGVAGEAAAPKVAFTDGDTVVILADFYRAGDGINESFTAKMIVSAVDEAGDVDGDQKVWVQGVGCGDAIANFN